MALLRRRKGPGDTGMSPFKAGIIAIILIAIVAWAIYKERNPW
jgi:hypothetical protein